MILNDTDIAAYLVQFIFNLVLCYCGKYFELKITKIEKKCSVEEQAKTHKIVHICLTSIKASITAE
jgi:hypothetical protein